MLAQNVSGTILAAFNIWWKMNKERAEREKLDWLKFGNETFTVEGGGGTVGKIQLVCAKWNIYTKCLKNPSDIL